MAVFLLLYLLHASPSTQGITCMELNYLNSSQPVNVVFSTYTLNSIIRIPQQYNENHHITQMATIAETKDSIFQHC